MAKYGLCLFCTLLAFSCFLHLFSLGMWVQSKFPFSRFLRTPQPIGGHGSIESSTGPGDQEPLG